MYPSWFSFLKINVGSTDSHDRIACQKLGSTTRCLFNKCNLAYIYHDASDWMVQNGILFVYFSGNFVLITFNSPSTNISMTTDRWHSHS